MKKKLKVMHYVWPLFAGLLFAGCECLDCMQANFFKVAPDYLLFTEEGQQRAFTVTSSMSWELVDVPEGFQCSPLTGNSGAVTVTVSLTDPDVPDLNYVRVKASDGTERVVTLAYVAPNVLEEEYYEDVIIPGTYPVGTIPYVGAFWRANEVGERLIKLAEMNDLAENRGAWKVSVVYLDPRWSKDDRVILSTVASSDANVWTDSPGDAEDYLVSGNKITVGGTVDDASPDIFFRIGINNTFAFPSFEPESPDYTTSFPARYGLLELSYGTPVKKCIIFLRQGDGADYLMTSNDRPYSARISPYNLTSSEYGRSMAGRFVDFPTQAGAFYQWENTVYERWAFDPYNDPHRTYMSYPSRDYSRKFWNEISDVQESCPVGYRRINDGPIDGVSTGSVEGSEVRQSLWLRPNYNPYSGASTPLFGNNLNAVVGYYADGFFDRRIITDGPNVTNKGINSTVLAQSHEIAHMGTLFYNPDLPHASLFFPYNGWRSFSTGALELAGREGYYWTSSASTTTAAAAYIHRMHVGAYGSGMNTASRNAIFGIRCVRIAE